jgi:hypothetical protein
MEFFLYYKNPVKEVREIYVKTWNYIYEAYPKKENNKDLK